MGLHWKWDNDKQDMVEVNTGLSQKEWHDKGRFVKPTQKPTQKELEEFRRAYFGVPSSTPDTTAYRTYTSGNTGTSSGIDERSWHVTPNAFDVDLSNYGKATLDWALPKIAYTQPKEKEMESNPKIMRKLIREIIKNPAKEALIEKYYCMDADTLFFAMLDPEKLFEAAMALETEAREEEE